MKRSIISITIATTIVLALTGCSSSKNDGNTIANPRDTANGINKSGSTETKTAPAPVAAKPGSKAVPNETPWRVVTEISADCANTLKPFRDFEKKFPNGLARESNATAAETEAMNKAMTIVQSNRKICSKKDFDLWYNEEYLGWSRSNK